MVVTIYIKVSEPFLVVLNSLPKIALGPVIIIWVGAGMPAIITVRSINFINCNSLGIIEWIYCNR